jgi:sulfur-oxidizing protein SoxX
VKRLAGLLLLAAASGAASGADVAGDALDAALAGPGDAARGREVFRAREQGHCVICHAAAGIAPAGNLGPALDGIGARLSAGQLRLRIVDITRVKPDAAMPAFHRREGLTRVAAAYAGKTILDAQQVEDLVAFLSSLR